MLVKDVMTKEIIALPPDESIESAAVAMTHHGISSLIVRGESHVLGILTERDVLTRVVARGENPSEIRGGDVMTSELISVSPDTSIAKPLTDRVSGMLNLLYQPLDNIFGMTAVR